MTQPIYILFVLSRLVCSVVLAAGVYQGPEAAPILVESLDMASRSHSSFTV